MVGRIFITGFFRAFRGWSLELRGATAIEYALLGAGIALAISGAVYFFGDQLTALFYDDMPSALAR